MDLSDESEPSLAGVTIPRHCEFTPQILHTNAT